MIITLLHFIDSVNLTGIRWIRNAVGNPDSGYSNCIKVYQAEFSVH